MSGSSDEVQVSLSALITGFWTLPDSLNWFWDSSACLELFWTFLDSWNCFCGFLHVWTLFGDVLLFVPVVRACLSCVGRLCAKVPLRSNDVAAKGHKRWPIRVT